MQQVKFKNIYIYIYKRKENKYVQYNSFKSTGQTMEEVQLI